MSDINRVSVTEQLDFCSCRRYWLWSNYGLGDGRGFVPKSPKMEFALGTGVHLGLETYFRTGGDSDRVLGVFDDWYYRDFSASMARDYPVIWENLQIECEKIHTLGRGMLQNFMIFNNTRESVLRTGTPWQTPDGHSGIEQKIVLPISNPKTGEPTGVNLVGKVDLIMVRDDELWVVDHKTASYAPASGGIDVDEQLTAYMYMIWRKFGIRPRGAVYNVLLKSLPEPPYQLKPTKAEPVAFSRAKNQNTVYEVYYQTLIDNHLDPASYADVLEGLQKAGWSKYFVQQEVIRNEEELLAYERRLYQRVRDMKAVLANHEDLAYPTPSARSCGYCSFLSPCKAKDDGGDFEAVLDSQFVRRDA